MYRNSDTILCACLYKNMTKKEVKKAIGRNKSFAIVVKDIYRTYYRVLSVDFTDDRLRINSGWNMVEVMYKDIQKVYKYSVGDDASVTHGSDPELFFVREGVMIPSTSVLTHDTSQVTRDGFQLELHPRPQRCRQVASSGLKQCIIEARDYAVRNNLKLSYNLSYTVDNEVWNATDDKTKRFGCHPTENVHEPEMERGDGLNERFRAGGGHLHVGQLTLKERKDLPTIVTLFDIVVGNTLVLLDRDPANVTRRINYGRAGEYRAKKYGVEYRVPSNFWLKHYVLFSLANGLIRNAITHYRNGQHKKLLEIMNIDDVRRAINTNDFDLALENFKKYTEFLDTTGIPYQCGISYLNYKKFIRWVTSESPLSKFRFDLSDDEAVTNHWTTLSPMSADGFEKFIKNMVIRKTIIRETN